MGASRRRRAPVMADVGRLAGVSHQTVSRVINGSPNVRPSTRSRVLEAMEELGYRPNSVARALVTGRSRTLGVVSVDTTLYGPASTLLGIERAAHDAGYFTVIASLTALTATSVTEAIERLRRHGVDGVLVIAPFADAALALPELPAGVPLVGVEAGSQGHVTSVGVDQVCGARIATRHLLDLGHRTVWHVAGPQDFHEARDRLSGWRETLEAAGAPVPEPLAGDWSAQRGYELGARLGADVTAVFVANDQMALGVLRALHEAGRAVPEEVSVVGFDDIPESAYFLPPLTTVRQDFDEMGRRAVQRMLGLLDDLPEESGPALELTLEPTLVTRASTARLPRR